MLEHGGRSLTVDIGSLQPQAFEEDQLYVFIGEVLKAEPGNYILSARVCRNVEGIDVALFEQALQLRRQFLTKSAST